MNPRCRCWCFTLNNYSEDEVTQLHTTFELCADFAAQEEISKEGTPHIQGYLYFKDAKTFTCVKALIPRAHIETARKAVAARIYCLKKRSRNGRQWSKQAPVNKWVKPTVEEFMAAAMSWYVKKYM